MRRGAWLAAAMLPGPAAAGVIGDDAPACRAGAPAIQATVVGLKDRTGGLKLELFPATEGDFLRDDRDLLAEGKLFRRVRAPTPPAGPVTMCIRVPGPGRYALLFTHDRDGRNKFNFWRDGVGLPHAGRLRRSRPRVAQALVRVGGGTSEVLIRVQYLRGLSGFGPVG